MPFPPTPDHVWDITTPADTQPANQGGADFRALKDDVMQRLSLLSGTFANRPTPETVNATWGGAGFGLLYFTTDTGVIYQWNGSAWAAVNFSGVNLLASASLTGQNGNVGTTTLYAVPGGAPVQLYGLAGYTNITTPATSSSTLPELNIFWTDNDSNTPTSTTLTGTTTQNTLGTIGGIAFTAGLGIGSTLSICPKPGTNISYQTVGYLSSGATQMVYSVRARVVLIG